MVSWKKAVKYSSNMVEVIGIIIVISIIYSGIMLRVGLVSNPETSFSF